MEINKKKQLRWPLTRTREANTPSDGLLIIFCLEARILLFFMLNKEYPPFQIHVGVSLSHHHHCCLLLLLFFFALILVSISINIFSCMHTAGNSVAISKVNNEVARIYKQQVDNQAKELFVPFRCFCTRKEVSPASLSPFFFI